ncbi:MAG: hypothetical protein JXR03_01395 [Cyclobacteriaceae bacterium]
MIILILGIGITYCAKSQNPNDLIQKSIEAHGMNSINEKKISFSFRNKDYSVSRKDGNYTYTRFFEKDSKHIQDYLYNSTELHRLIGEDTLELSEDLKGKYASSVNSVLYFFQVPYVLTDDAALTEYAGKDKVGEESYHLVKITFEKENGGNDHDDVFLYWVNDQTFLIDYFAYRYSTNRGGVRFREAYNRVKKSGITFQDYVNYKADKKTPLTKLSSLFEQGRLEKLSLIENEQINVSSLD